MVMGLTTTEAIMTTLEFITAAFAGSLFIAGSVYAAGLYVMGSPL
jgi:hypothetical protein